MSIEAEQRRTMVFVSIVDPARPFYDLSERRQALLERTTLKLRERISLAKIFTANTVDARQAAEMMQRIYGWDMGIESSDLLGKDTYRFMTFPDAYEIKDVLSQRHDNSAVPCKAVICIAEQAAVAGALIRLTGVALERREAEELEPGEAVIVHFNTNKWNDVGPFTFSGAELVQPGENVHPVQRLDLI